MGLTNFILPEYDRSREIERMGGKILQAMERDLFFLDRVKNLPDDEKLDTFFDLLDEIDPTPNCKYVRWLVNNYTKGKFRIEDKVRVKEALENFDRSEPRLNRYGFSPDINQYDFHSLEEIIDKIEDGDNIKGDSEYHKRFDELRKDEYEILYDGPYGILVMPKTEYASYVLGNGTAWCMAAEHDNMYDDYYNDKTPLYIWKDNTGLYQFWFGDIPQFMDNNDKPIPYDKIREMRKKYPPLDKLFEDEEREIKSVPWSTYWYARDVIKGRWPEAEPYIMKVPYWAYWYARDVIKGRWPEAEPYIMKEPEHAYKYAKDVIKVKWSEAEQDPFYAFPYPQQTNDGG